MLLTDKRILVTGVLNDASIAFSVANENPSSKDVAEELTKTFGAREPNFKLLGPTQPRAALSGVVIHHGFVAAEWGDVARAADPCPITYRPRSEPHPSA